MNVRREELRKESPEMHHLEVTKKIGEEWMTLSDEKKQPYLDAAVEDKIRYGQIRDWSDFDGRRFLWNIAIFEIFMEIAMKISIFFRFLLK